MQLCFKMCIVAVQFENGNINLLFRQKHFEDKIKVFYWIKLIKYMK